MKGRGWGRKTMMMSEANSCNLIRVVGGVHDACVIDDEATSYAT